MDPLPRRRLHPALIAAVIQSPIPRKDVARRSYFTQTATLSALLNAYAVRPSPMTLARLKRVARVVGYTGELWAEELQPAYTSASSDRFTADSLPAPSRQASR